MQQPLPGNPFVFTPSLPRPRRWNACAVTGFILSLFPVAGIAGFILCIVGVAQCGRTGDRGRGLAAAGIAISTAIFVLTALYCYNIAANILWELSYYFPAEEEYYHAYGYTLF